MMKKVTLTALLGLLMMFTTGMALAEVYSYKVYDPKTNKTYTAEIRPTVLNIEGQKCYMTEFYTLQGKPLCFFGHYTNKNNQGLVGGQCQDSASVRKMLGGQAVKPYTMGWRETSRNTFYREIESLKQEMAEQGIYPY